jgi:hypothetical protein
VFLISGLWHGANWNFIIWGGLHGLYLVGSLLTREPRARMVEWLQLERFPMALALGRGALTFALVTFSWIFFRATSLGDALLVIERMSAGLMYALTNFGEAMREHRLGVPPFWSKELLFALGLVLVIAAAHLLEKSRALTEVLATQPVWARWSAYYAMLLLILSVGMYGSQSFIYFQF